MIVSIIVPIYNSAPYLKSCVLSLLRQTYAAIEVILVDDGSTDGSASICDALAHEDNRVQVIHQENGGVSAARNAGIAAAKGDFIQFCDSDDIVCADITKRLVEGIQSSGADLAICGIQECFAHKTIKCNLLGETDKLCELSEFHKSFAKHHCHEFFGANYNKLYRTRLIGADCRFLCGVSFAEDLLFNISYFTKMQSVYVVGQALYSYNKCASGSLTKRRPALEDSWADCQRAYHAFLQYFQNAYCEVQYQNDIHHFLLFLLDWTFLRQSLPELWRQRKAVIGLCLDPEIQCAAKDANTYKITVRVFKFAVKHHWWFLIYCLRFGRMCLGIN